MVHNVQAAIEASALKQQLNAIFQDMPQDLQATMLSSPHRAALMQGSGPRAQVRAILAALYHQQKVHMIWKAHGVAAWCYKSISVASLHTLIWHVHMHLSYMSQECSPVNSHSQKYEITGSHCASHAAECHVHCNLCSESYGDCT